MKTNKACLLVMAVLGIGMLAACSKAEPVSQSAEMASEAPAPDEDASREPGSEAAPEPQPVEASPAPIITPPPPMPPPLANTDAGEPGAPATEPVNTDSVDPIDAAMAAMRPANIAFNAPKELNIDSVAPVVLKLSFDQSEEALRPSVSGPGDVRSASVMASRHLEARLSGRDLDITAVSEEVQVLPSTGVTSWRWDVKALSPGPHQLHLTLTAILDLNGSPSRRDIETYDTTIDVQVTPKQQLRQFVGKNWQWLWSALLIPLLGWLWKQRKSQGG